MIVYSGMPNAIGVLKAIKGEETQDNSMCKYVGRRL